MLDALRTAAKSPILWAIVGVLLVVAMVTGGVQIEVGTTDDGKGNKTRVIRVAKPSVPEGVQIDKGNEISVAEQREAGARPFSVDGDALPLANAGPDIHEDTRDETPPGITRDEADDALITPEGLVRPQPPAGAQNYRCDRRYVKNYSQRSPGSKVSMLVLHFTVSRPGSINAIFNLFNTPSFGASSTFGVELTGECQQWVPFGSKPWTNGAFNSVTETWEIVTNDLSRAQWLASPLIKNGILANMLRDRARARGIPLRLVDPVGCTPKAGITDHGRLECGNSHWDVGKNFPWDVLMRQLRGDDAKTRALKKRQRSHRIAHAKLKSRCRTRVQREGAGCAALRKRNRDLHEAGI